MNTALNDDDFAALQALLDAARKLKDGGWSIRHVTQHGMSAELAGLGLALRRADRVGKEPEAWEAVLSVKTTSDIQAVLNGATHTAHCVIQFAAEFGVKL